MKQYSRQDAKAYARTHVQGIWAATLIPFADDLTIDEQAFRRNLRHWIDDLGIDGISSAASKAKSFRCRSAKRFGGRSRPKKATARSKYWQELLGQTGGRVRLPMFELTGAEREATRRARAGAPHKAAAAH